MFRISNIQLKGRSLNRGLTCAFLLAFLGGCANYEGRDLSRYDDYPHIKEYYQNRGPGPEVMDNALMAAVAMVTTYEYVLAHKGHKDSLQLCLPLDVDVSSIRYQTLFDSTVERIVSGNFRGGQNVDKDVSSLTILYWSLEDAYGCDGE